MHSAKIAMIGASGTGKTTLVTALYDYATSQRSSVPIVPHVETAAILDQRRRDLESLPERFRVEPGQGIQGGDVLNRYLFEVRERNKAAALLVEFIDIVGGTVTDGAVEKSPVAQFIRDCEVVIIPVDSPAIMERNRRYSDFTRQSQQIPRLGNLFRFAYKDLSNSRLVLLVPVKCEKYLTSRYLNDEDKPPRLLPTVESTYKSLLDVLRTEQLASHVAVAITPVATVGTVEFASYECGEDGHPRPVFKLIDGTFVNTFEPRDADQIWRYILRFLLQPGMSTATRRRRRWWFRTRESLDGAWLGGDEGLRQRVKDFADGWKTTDPFDIVTGDRLLGR